MTKRAEAFWVVFGFACLGVASTYPLIVEPGSRLPSDLLDPLLTAWTLAWDADRIRHGLRGIWDAPSFFPYRHTLLYSDHLLGVAIFTAPIQWLTRNPVLAYNSAFVGSVVLSGGGMYLLARELTGRRDAALVAGVIFAFQPFRVAHASHLQWLLTGWLPLSLWALHRYFASGAWRYLLASAVFFLLQSLTASYFTYYGLVPLVIVGLVEWWRARTPVRNVVLHAIPAVVLVAAVMMPIASAYYAVRAQQGLKRSSDDILPLSADVGNYFSASSDLRLWGGLGNGGGEHDLFLGATAMVLGVLALVARRRSPSVVLYASVLASAFVLSLGPSPTAWGHRLGLPGPYGLLLHVVPGLDGLRAPARLAVVVQIALAVLAAFGAGWLLDRVARRSRVALLALLVAVIAAEGWAAPIRMPAFDPKGEVWNREAYAYLASLPSGAVLELPTSLDRPDLEFWYQYLTLVHRHPVVNGHSGYVSPLVQWLGGGHSPLREADRERDAVEMLRAIGVRYIVVQPGRYGDAALADPLLDVIRNDRQQIIERRLFGRTTIAVLAPLELPAVPPASAVPASRIRASASVGAERLPLLFDGDRDTRWLTGISQSGGEWLQLDFDRASDVRVVRMQLGARSFGDYPRDLAIDAIEEGDTRTLFRGSVLPQFARGLLADSEYPFIEIVLPANRARSLRLRQVGAAHSFFWSIHELQLLEHL